MSVRKVLDSDLLSDVNFYEEPNTLHSFLRYCLEMSKEMDIFLVKTDKYYLIEVKSDVYDDSLSSQEFVLSELKSSSPTHPHLVLATQICDDGHFVEIQASSPEDSYGVHVESRGENTEVEFFNQHFRNDSKSETLYTIAFDDNHTYVWSTIRSFAEHNSNVSYFVNNEDDETTKVM